MQLHIRIDSAAQLHAKSAAHSHFKAASHSHGKPAALMVLRQAENRPKPTLSWLLVVVWSVVHSRRPLQFSSEARLTKK